MKASTDRIIGRITAVTLFTLAFTFGLSRTGTSVTTTGPRPAVVCGVGGCEGNNPSNQGIRGGGHGGGGGGIIKVAP